MECRSCNYLLALMVYNISNSNVSSWCILQCPDGFYQDGKSCKRIFDLSNVKFVTEFVRFASMASPMAVIVVQTWTIVYLIIRAM